jgi:hypothetical protein
MQHRTLCILALTFLAGCAATPEQAMQQTDWNICRATMGGVNQRVADNERRRRGLDCTPHSPTRQPPPGGFFRSDEMAKPDSGHQAVNDAAGAARHSTSTAATDGGAVPASLDRPPFTPGPWRADNLPLAARRSCGN